MANPKKRIVHFIHKDGDGGGPNTVSKQITFLSHFYHVHVIHGGSGRIAHTCEELSIPHTQVETERLFGTILRFPLLVFLLFTLRPDLVILHGQWAGPFGALAARLAWVPKILYIAHWPSYFTDWDVLRIVRNRVAEWIPCRLADKVIALSQANYIIYLQIFPRLESKMMTLPNSIDEHERASEVEISKLREEHLWDRSKVNIVSVARLVDQKRVDWLLHA